MDVEGSEIILLSAISERNVLKTEFMVEIGNPENARLLLVEMKRLGLNAFSQKIIGLEFTRSKICRLLIEKGAYFSHQNLRWTGLD